VRGLLSRYDDLQSFSASESCPIDQQTSAEAGLSIHAYFNQNDFGGWGQKGPVGTL
jgi:hypothetical protein